MQTHSLVVFDKVPMVEAEVKRFAPIINGFWRTGGSASSLNKDLEIKP